jgi:hypothetical protein
MGRLFRLGAYLAMVFGLAACLAVGCRKKDTPPTLADAGAGKPTPGAGKPTPGAGKPNPGFDKWIPPGPLLPENEDPAVADYVKQKGWLLMRDLRISDGRPTVVLSVENRDKPFQDVVLTDADYKMIARSKTVRILDLGRVQATDDGLTVIAGIPQLEWVTVKGNEVTDAGVQALAQCRALDHVSLVLTKKVTDAGVKALAALPKLQSLYFMGLNLNGSAFEAFAGSKTLESVVLDFAEGLTDDGARHLAKLPNLNELVLRTSFGEKKLTAAGIKAIVDARLPAKFEFDMKLLDDALLEVLVAKGWLYGPTPAGAKQKRPAGPEEVRSISLGNSQVTDKGLRTVLNCTNATSLFLERTGVTDETLKNLTAFKKLDYLALEQTKVTGAGLDAISALPLRHIAMQGCELSEDAFKAFGKMTALEELWLSGARMKAEWLQHIATLPKLKELNLMRANFNDAAVKYLTTMPSLRNLTLNDTKLGDTGFQELLALPKLQQLYVDSTLVSKEVYLRAKKERPKLNLYFYSYDQ